MMKRGRDIGRSTKHRRRQPRASAPVLLGAGATITGLLPERLLHSEAAPRLTGGDLDADWQRAASSGEEAVGGSVATPDQDVVDEIGEALGVAQADEAPLHTSDELLEARRRHYWHLERLAAEEADRKEQ
jgi:hypothetical protein